MTSGETEVWIYVGDCPICQSGLRRVRVCTETVGSAKLHGYILCDDCERIWLEPDVHSPQSFADSQFPACPVCGQPMFGLQARWATVDDLAELGWQDQCIVESIQVSEHCEDLLEIDDLAIDLDSPEPLPVHHHDLHGDHESPQDQLAEVMPQLDRSDENSEPKPGC